MRSFFLFLSGLLKATGVFLMSIHVSRFVVVLVNLFPSFADDRNYFKILSLKTHMINSEDVLNY